jgi:Arc/MetJ-type ribon-helix-helix transcriptional regulator
MFDMLNMLGVRLDPKLERLLASVARRRRMSRSELVRVALRRYLDVDLGEGAREQSLRASVHDEPDLDHDDRGWTP